MNKFQKTWVGQEVEESVSLQSLLDSCLYNVNKAAKDEREHRELLARLPPDDIRVRGTDQEPSLAAKIVMAVGDQPHWREYAAYYRARIAKEGANTMIKIKRPRFPGEPPPPKQPERQAGDDSEEEEVPF